MKVAGFSVGGVMVSTAGSDPVDRGSTPFLPTTFKLFICYLEIEYTFLTSVREDRCLFKNRSEVYVVAYCSHKAKVAGSTPAAATVVIFIDSI